MGLVACPPSLYCFHQWSSFLFTVILVLPTLFTKDWLGDNPFGRTSVFSSFVNSGFQFAPRLLGSPSTISRVGWKIFWDMAQYCIGQLVATGIPCFWLKAPGIGSFQGSSIYCRVKLTSVYVRIPTPWKCIAHFVRRAFGGLSL